MENKPSIHWKTTMNKTTTLCMAVEMDDNDIFNWLTECQNPETLKYLGRAALRFAHALENKEDESWHSDVLR